MPAIDIRPCTEADLPAVVDLLLANTPAAERRAGPLIEHAREVYFDHPWLHPEIAPLVCFGADGRLNGFIGATARRMTFRGEQILVAVPGNFVVRPGPDGKVDAFSAIGLVRRFLTGPQDLSLTDTSNDLSRRMWEAAGGAVVAGYSFDWFRPIRPVRALLQVVEAERKTALPMSRWLHSVGGVVDVAGSRVLARMAAGKRVDAVLAPFDPDFLLQLLARHRAYEIVGVYDRDSIAWLMRQLEAKAQGRTLVCHTVTDGKRLRLHPACRRLCRGAVLLCSRGALRLPAERDGVRRRGARCRGADRHGEAAAAALLQGSALLLLRQSMDGRPFPASRTDGRLPPLHPVMKPPLSRP